MKIFQTADGSHSIFSSQFGASYHSKYGAIQETQHVYIEAALKIKASHNPQVSLLELGFGTGLSALMTCLEAQRLQSQVHYCSVEAFPISTELAKCLNFHHFLGADSKKILLDLHLAPWGFPVSITPMFTLQKVLGKIEEQRFTNNFDIIYFDAFSPSAQPELWKMNLLHTMYNSLLPGGILVTYCSKGTFTRILKQLGFVVEKIKGPPGKREITRATKPVNLLS